MSLQAQLLEERQRSYARLRGGFPIPLAGAIWWLALAALGASGARLGVWIMVAFVTSGLIFPLALGLARVFGCAIS